MPRQAFPRDNPPVDLVGLLLAVQEAVPAVAWTAAEGSGSAAVALLWDGEELTPEEQLAAAEAIVQYGVETLTQVKARVAAEIQAERDRRTLLGFKYTGMSAVDDQIREFTFSRSDRAEKNYTGLSQNPTLVPAYPFPWNDRSDTDAMVIVDEPALLAFLSAARSSIANITSQAGGYTFQVIVANSSEEVEALKTMYFAEPVL